MNKNTTQSGYSLIEIVIYVAIFAGLAVVIMNSFIVVIGSFNETRTNRDILESSNTAMERISREIRSAQSIDTANSAFGTNPGILQLNSLDAGGASRIVKIESSSGDINLSENSVLTGNLIGQNVEVTSLIFRQITTAHGSGVKIEMTLKDTRGKRQRTENFYDTIILRGGY